MTYSGLTDRGGPHSPKILPDFASGGSLDNPPVWIHRHTPDAEIYFVANQSDTPQNIEARFRVAGKDVQIWRPMDGAIDTGSAAAYTSLAQIEDRSGNRQPGLQPAPYAPAPASLPSHWTLPNANRFSSSFATRPIATLQRLPHREAVQNETSQPHRPLDRQLPRQLGRTAQHPAAQADLLDRQHQSRRQVFLRHRHLHQNRHASASWFHPGHHIFLDLGKVRDIAEVEVNGKSAGLVWAPPYRVDVTSTLKPGPNKLAIKVTNEWTNRQMGDRLLPADKHILATPPPPPGRPGGLGGFVPPAPPESGLLGDVTLSAEAR